ncbi:MAG: hypothetical protein QY332_08660 [Anaerolineales bacterium]|nr:MAG: hypothetical protein QY332_08660 [Anaerolineales bacterium]
MKNILLIVPRWFPALLLMLVIFAFSSRASAELPNFGGWDYFIKKAPMPSAMGCSRFRISTHFQAGSTDWLGCLPFCIPQRMNSISPLYPGGTLPFLTFLFLIISVL